eukprot:404189_1
MSTALNIFIVIIAGVSIFYMKWNTSQNDIEFVTETKNRIEPISDWMMLKWNFTTPLNNDYLINQYYIQIIETILFRRPWSNALLNNNQNGFYSQRNILPLHSDYVHFLNDYRCIIGGDIYFDSRFIKKIKGPIYKQISERKQKRTFILDGIIQSIPFKNKNYETICKKKK